MPDQLPDDAELIEMAGEAAFKRGLGYARAGRVALSKVSVTALAGEAHGTETYSLWLKHAKGDWQWDCSCPAADDGAFCKHLVAAVLTARQEVSEDADDVAARPKGRAKPEALLTFLRAQPADRLAAWLQALADEDGDIEKRLLLYRAAEQPGALKPALAKLLNTGGFLDYRRAMAYAKRLHTAIEQLAEVLRRDPAECRVLCGYALGRLFKIYGNSDDSAGAIGEVVGAIADLHAQACAAAPAGVALVKPLCILMSMDGWGVLVLQKYWEALQSPGQAAYARWVLADFELLPPTRKDGHHFDEGFETCRRTEELARCAGDFGLLQRVLRRDLSHEWQHFRVLESLREFGRAREALAWAELAVKQFPKDGRLRASLAECLAESGMDEEAVEQAWQRFCQHPSDEGWDALKRHAKKSWPSWRQRALDHVMALERGDATVRLALLLHDGDAQAAIGVADSHAVAAHMLHTLAQWLRRSDPAAAGAFYLRLARQQADHLRSASDYPRLVAHLKDASKLLPAEDWRPLLDSVRENHARKPKLMGMLAQAGL
ncbi:MAG: SWIM zinc finger family protein [Rhodanobacter sp.]